ncbi:hypothetical protein [Amycolatopsis pigmentata]|uniref:RDD family protein n=1 Tax=Amycolatopsis pigmentata TaxID=450801 RepID=A0ABW5FL83_9PSEU
MDDHSDEHQQHDQKRSHERDFRRHRTPIGPPPLPPVTAPQWPDNPLPRTEGRVTLIDGLLAAAVLAGLTLNAALGW